MTSDCLTCGRGLREHTDGSPARCYNGPGMYTVFVLIFKRRSRSIARCSACQDERDLKSGTPLAMQCHTCDALWRFVPDAGQTP